MDVQVDQITLRDVESNILVVYSRILLSLKAIYIIHVLYLVFQDKYIWTSFMDVQVDQITLRDVESNILMVYSRILLSLKALYIIYVLYLVF